MESGRLLLGYLPRTLLTYKRLVYVVDETVFIGQDLQVLLARGMVYTAILHKGFSRWLYVLIHASALHVVVDFGRSSI